MNSKTPNNVMQKAISEKIGYKTACAQWRELKVRGDVRALAELSGRSTVSVSKAVNHGIGSITLLRKVAAYYRNRVSESESNQYLPNDKKNYY